VREAIAQHYRDTSQDRDATTDADGHFRLGELLDGSYSLRAWSLGFVLTARGGGGDVKPGATVDFLGERVARVPVSVTMPDGSNAVGAVLEIGQGRNTRTEGFDPAQPTVALAAGHWELKASLGDDKNGGPPRDDVLVSDVARIDVTLDATPAP